jgi:two-component system chemotaxis sensor kinase CheA
MLDDHSAWRAGQLKSVAGVLINASKVVGDSTAQKQIESALAQALTQSQGAPLLTWLDAYEKKLSSKTAGQPDVSSCCNECEPERKPDARRSASAPEESSAKAAGDDGPKFGRRAEDAFNAPKSLKVDQAKIDRLMNLIGEMIVSKNALPYLAQRAEVQFGVRELSREIKAQYAIINRITDEMQDAIMQVRMMSVSFVFQPTNWAKKCNWCLKGRRRKPTRTSSRLWPIRSCTLFAIVSITVWKSRRCGVRRESLPRA